MTVTKLGKDESGNIVELGFKERTSHIEVIGSTGVGKTTLLTGIFYQDIIQGKSGAYFDPDGDVLHAMLRRLPDDKIGKVFWFDPNNNKFPPINLLYCADISDAGEVTASASFAMHIFKRLWDINPRTPQLENLLWNSFIALIYSKMTLAQLPELLFNDDFRLQVIGKIPVVHVMVRWFWEKRYNQWPDRLKEERTDSTLTRVLVFLTNPFIKRIIEQNTTIDFRQAMKAGHVFFFRLAPKREDGKGGIGEEGVHLLGTMLMALILDAAMSRPEGERNFFSLVVDEFHLFSTSDFETILTRLRKYGVAATLGYQYRGQLDDRLKGAVAQTSTKIVFRVDKDAPVFAPMFAQDSPPSEIRREPILAPAIQPIQSLLGARGGQKNPVINQFIHKRLSVFDDAIKLSHQKVVGMSRWGPKIGHVPVSDLDLVRRELNRILYEVMVEENPRKIIPIDIFFPFVYQAGFLTNVTISSLAPLQNGIFPFVSSILFPKVEMATIDPDMDIDMLLPRLSSVPLIQRNVDKMIRGYYLNNRISRDHPIWQRKIEIEVQQNKQSLAEKDTFCKEIAGEAFSQLWLSTSKESREKLVEHIYNACYEFYITNGLLYSLQIWDRTLLMMIEQSKAVLMDAEAKYDRYWEEFDPQTLDWKNDLIRILDPNYDEYNKDYERHKRKYRKQIEDHKYSSDLYEYRSFGERFRKALKEGKDARQVKEECLSPYWYSIKGYEKLHALVHHDYLELINEITISIKEEIALLKAFVLELQEFMEALADDPIQEVSRWKEEPGLRENPQYTITDMEKELLSLEPGIAWCRIVDLKAPVGQKNKKVKIRILREYPDLFAKDQSYLQRLQDILDKTDKEYGVKPFRPIITLPAKEKKVAEEKAEHEIKEEQTEPPKLTRARGGKLCPHCSMPNALDAKFCHQCGMQFER